MPNWSAYSGTPSQMVALKVVNMVNIVNMLPESRVRPVTDRLVDVEPEEFLRTSRFETSKNCYAFQS